MEFPAFLLRPEVWLVFALYMILAGVIGAIRGERHALSAANAAGAGGFLVALWWAADLDRAAVWPVFLAAVSGYFTTIYAERSKGSRSDAQRDAGASTSG